MMSYVVARFRYKSQTSLLMCNNRLSNPFDQYTLQIRELKGRRKKEEKEQTPLLISKLEFHGHGYWNSEGNPILPTKMIGGVLYDVLLKHSQGPKRAAIRVLEDSPLEYDGPPTAEELWEAGEPWVYRTMANTGSRKRKQWAVRTRPRFDNWAATISLEFDNEVFSSKTIHQFQEEGGEIGIGDAKVLGFGRFTAEPI